MSTSPTLQKTAFVAKRTAFELPAFITEEKKRYIFDKVKNVRSVRKEKTLNNISLQQRWPCEGLFC